MPAPSAVDRLPEPLRHELERRLVGGGFSGYTALAEWLAEQGYEISRSAVHRYGQRVKRRMDAIRASTEAARLIAEAAPDRDDARSAAVIALVQSELFEAMLALSEAEQAEPEDRVRLLSQAARAIAEASRASVAQKRWAEEIRADDARRLQQMENEARAGRSGLDADTLRRVREEIYGV